MSRTRPARLTLRWMLTAALAFGGLARAEDPGFSVWWYDYAVAPNESGYNTDGPQTVTDDGVRDAVMYTSGDFEAVRTYLTNAAAAGLRLVVALPSPRVAAADAPALASYIQRVEQHAAAIGAPDLVRGWYLYDEPDTLGSGFTPQVARDAYLAVKSVSDKPIYANIDGDETGTGFDSTNTQNRYRDSFDVMLTHDYPLARNAAEFAGFENSFFGLVNGWKSWMRDSAANARANGKAWVPVIQGYGSASFDLRLPTAAEQRFMSFYSVHLGADGLAYWSKARSLQSPAQAGAPYPDDGESWAQDVFRPLVEELNELTPAVNAGFVAGAVTDTHADVWSQVVVDPDDGTHYLLTVNLQNAAASAGFDLSGIGLDLAGAMLLGADGLEFEIVGNTFSQSFTPYEVRNFRLVPVPEPVGAGGLLLGLALLSGRSLRDRGMSVRQ